MSEPSQSTESEVTAPEPVGPPPSGDVTARAGSYYRKTRYLLVLGLIGYGIWNFHDGFYAWPAQNKIDRQHGFDKVRFSDMDIAFNRALAFACPGVGLALLAWTLRSSRGAFKLEGQTLHVPGHKPITLDQIEALDKQKWDRKGIAVVTYRLNNDKEATFKLDDFVYERDGIDTIFQWIEWSLLQPHTPKPAANVAAAPPPPPPPARPKM